MTFHKNAAGYTITFEDGTTEVVPEKEWKKMLARQLKAKTR